MPHGSAWVGYAVLRQVAPQRQDLIQWIELGNSGSLTERQVLRAIDAGHSPSRLQVAPAVLLPDAIASEYPDTADEVLALLMEQGVTKAEVERLLTSVTKVNRLMTGQRGNRRAQQQSALHVVLGTPALGVSGSIERKTHLAAWYIPPAFISSTARGASRTQGGSTSILPQLAGASALWTTMLEARPEVILRRDRESSASWLLGKRVMVLGAGALGAPIAAACVRAGVQKIIIADRGLVNPGVLVRQPYDDSDIAELKVTALTNHLRSIDPVVAIEKLLGNIVGDVLTDETPPPDVDLVIDATADRAVRTFLERHRTIHRKQWPTLASVLIGHQAAHGIATIAHPSASGGGADILRRLGLALRAQPTTALTEVLEDFYPDPPRTTFFQPEPGCSDITFVGSHADVTGLAGQLLSGVLSSLRDSEATASMHALVVPMPKPPGTDSDTGPTWFCWPNDTVMRSEGAEYEVRVSPLAAAEMRGEARKGRRTRTARVETGGALLGAFDSAANILWVDEATSPPPDSVMSEIYFRHGSEGVADQISARVDATARVTSFVGMWHTHPYGQARPSDLDNKGIRQLVAPLPDTPPRASMLILGGYSRWEEWLDNGTWPEAYVMVVEDVTAPHDQHESELPPLPDGMTWWSPRRPLDDSEHLPARRSWLLRLWHRLRGTVR